MTENAMPMAAPNNVPPAGIMPPAAIAACPKCGAPWVAAADICPWCGANPTGTQVLPLKFFLPKLEATNSPWDKDHPVHIGKALIIVLLSIIVGVALFFLLPILLGFLTVLRFVIIVLVLYAAITVGIAFGLGAGFKRLINVWAKGNSMWLAVVTSLLMFVPSALITTVVYWRAGAVHGVWSFLLGIAIPVLGIVGILIFIGLTTSGKFCPYCEQNVYERESVLKVHSCNTGALVTRITQGAPKEAMADLVVPPESKHAFSAVDMLVCKNLNCRHARIDVHQHMMYISSTKNNSAQENDQKQLVAQYEIASPLYESWTAGWTKKDSLA